jgi:hypothetical protein
MYVTQIEINANAKTLCSHNANNETAEKLLNYFEQAGQLTKISCKWHGEDLVQMAWRSKKLPSQIGWLEMWYALQT